MISSHPQLFKALYPLLSKHDDNHFARCFVDFSHQMVIYFINDDLCVDVVLATLYLSLGFGFQFHQDLAALARVGFLVFGFDFFDGFFQLGNGVFHADDEFAVFGDSWGLFFVEVEDGAAR